MTALQALKKASLQDWHPAQVNAALRMRGYSLRQLSLLNGYSNPNSLAKALHRPYPLAEAIIAEALGISAPEIWPSRYGADGKSNRKRGQKALLPAGAKPSRLRPIRNSQQAGGE
ncbi:helix-turn-helix transcriptional regulator [Stenotrophomonas sp. B1-1]|uniref:helix-turn-helix domain-containing protein n=1 Tax=Stenotrophomonas sp. B1-1 TaxID=2710648 RepID=UPI001F079D2C|nr:helix-turn-helix transcriptional regulator [Stenotrophomonas sp. B1-1]